MSDENKPTVVNDQKLYPQLRKKMREDYSHLKGKTLEVYYFLVDNQGQRFGVREIQRTLNYSSPSIAAYHLSRLEENELVLSTESGEYYVDKDPIMLGKLEDHIQVAGVLIPRILFYTYHAVVSIIIAGVLYWTEAETLVWFVFFVAANLVFIVILLYDAKKISYKLSHVRKEEAK